jgi:hypothetical protein
MSHRFSSAGMFAVAVLVVSPANACFLPGQVVFINGQPAVMQPTSSGLGKHWVAGADPDDGAPPRPPGGPGPGIPIGTIAGFGTNVIFDLVGHSTSLVDVGGGLFTIDFAPDFADVVSDSVDISVPTLSGGWTYTVDPTGPQETFSTGLFSFSGTGLGTDGQLYNVAFSASSSSGVFGNMDVTSVGPGPTFGVVHTQTITFQNVTASVSPEGGPVNSVSLASVNTTCQTDCVLVAIPEPGAGFLLGTAFAAFLALRVRYAR